METLGQRLRRARLEKGLEIRPIADQLRISARYVEAMETDDVRVLPGGLFSRSFYRQYAAMLGLSDQTLEAQISLILRDEAPPPIPGQEPPRAGRGLPPIRDLGARRPATARRPLVSVAILLAAVAACAAVYELWQRAREAPPATVSRSAPGKAGSQPSEPAEKSPIAEVRTLTAPPDQGGGLVLNLSATEKTWISVTAGGKVIFTGILEPSQSKKLSGAEGARLLIGNAGGVEVQWKGKSLGPIGPRGQVRIVVLTPEGAEILPPKKPPTDSL